uniref:Atx10homo_assoc domain-containing protein n=1 Tax=Rhabditophanes sp. KR3021 TaxID=114890 RepID=A0AC35TQ57_9BILA
MTTLTELFVGNKYATIQREEITNLLKEFTWRTKETFEEELSSLDGTNLGTFALWVAETVISDIPDLQKDSSEFLRLRAIYRLFVNLSAFSKTFVNSTSTLKLEHWIALLRIEPFIEETAYAICSHATSIFVLNLLNERLASFISDIANISNNHQSKGVFHSFNGAFVNLMANCGCFLSECFQSLDHDIVTYILSLAAKSFDQTGYDDLEPPIMHLNNTFFVLSLLERIVYEDFKNEHSLDRIKYILDILSFCALKKEELGKAMHEDTRSITLCGLILEKVFFIEDKESSKISKNLEELLKPNSDLAGYELKIKCLILITNCSTQSPKNQEMGAANNLLYYVLKCAGGSKNLQWPLLKEWSVLAINSLTKGCQANQKILDATINNNIL